LAGGKE
jgi:hypothetical protein